MRNQFGQYIAVGDMVGYVTKSGSHFTRKIGRVTGYGERKQWDGSKLEDTVLIDWTWEGNSAIARKITQKGPSPVGVGITRLFKLDTTGLPTG